MTEKEKKGQACEDEEPCCKEKTKTPAEEDKVKELTNDIKRIQADFENYRKQTEKRMEEFRKFAKKEIILDLLNVADNFELALKNTKDKEQFEKGVQMIYGQLNSLLEQEGVKPILKKEFDPNLHEALLTEKSDKKENTILEIIQKGYTLNDKVIRHAKVKVAKDE